MSFDDFVRVGQIGTLLIVTVTRIVSGAEVAYDVSGTSSVTIEIQKPNGKRLTPVVASFQTDGIDGVVTYVDSVGIFDDAGRWKVRGIANFANGDIFLGSWFGFSVDE